MIITNNPRFNEMNELDEEIKYYDEDSLFVLKTARDYIHKSYKLLNHPLYGNFRPMEMFYRTIILEESDELDLQSVELISSAILRVEQYLANVAMRVTNAKMIDDYSYIDYEIIKENFKGGIKKNV